MYRIDTKCTPLQLNLLKRGWFMPKESCNNIDINADTKPRIRLIYNNQPLNLQGFTNPLSTSEEILYFFKQRKNSTNLETVKVKGEPCQTTKEVNKPSQKYRKTTGTHGTTGAIAVVWRNSSNDNTIEDIYASKASDNAADHVARSTGVEDTNGYDSSSSVITTDFSKTSSFYDTANIATSTLESSKNHTASLAPDNIADFLSESASRDNTNKTFPQLLMILAGIETHYLMIPLTLVQLHLLVIPFISVIMLFRILRTSSPAIGFTDNSYIALNDSMDEAAAVLTVSNCKDEVVSILTLDDATGDEVVDFALYDITDDDGLNPAFDEDSDYDNDNTFFQYFDYATDAAATAKPVIHEASDDSYEDISGGIDEIYDGEDEDDLSVLDGNTEETSSSSFDTTYDAFPYFLLDDEDASSTAFDDSADNDAVNTEYDHAIDDNDDDGTSSLNVFVSALNESTNGTNKNAAISAYNNADDVYVNTTDGVAASFDSAVDDDTDDDDELNTADNYKDINAAIDDNSDDDNRSVLDCNTEETTISSFDDTTDDAFPYFVLDANTDDDVSSTAFDESSEDDAINAYYDHAIDNNDDGDTTSQKLFVSGLNQSSNDTNQLGSTTNNVDDLYVNTTDDAATSFGSTVDGGTVDDESNAAFDDSDDYDHADVLFEYFVHASDAASAVAKPVIHLASDESYEDISAVIDDTSVYSTDDSTHTAPDDLIVNNTTDEVDDNLALDDTIYAAVDDSALDDTSSIDFDNDARISFYESTDADAVKTDVEHVVDDNDNTCSADDTSDAMFDGGSRKNIVNVVSTGNIHGKKISSTSSSTDTDNLPLAKTGSLNTRCPDVVHVNKNADKLNTATYMNTLIGSIESTSDDGEIVDSINNAKCSKTQTLFPLSGHVKKESVLRRFMRRSSKFVRRLVNRKPKEVNYVRLR